MKIRAQYKFFFICTIIVCAAAAVLGLLFWTAGTRESESNALLVHSASVATALNEFSADFDECESESRSLINFGHADGDLSTCRARVLESSNRLKMLTQDNPSQTPNLDLLDYSIQQRFKDVDRLINAYQSGGSEAVLAIVQTGTTLANSRQVNAARGFVQKEESRLLIERGAAVERSRSNLSRLIFAVFIFWVISFIVSVTVNYLKIREQQRNETQLRNLYYDAVKKSTNAVVEDADFVEMMGKVAEFLGTNSEDQNNVY